MRHTDFDSGIPKMFGIIGIIGILSAVAPIGALIFAGWVVVKVMQFYGVI